jgi:hypothetical protein
MSNEPTTKGNPQGLTIQQHVHTARAISLFYNNENKVEVHLIAEQQVVQKAKKATVFCTRRTWDQRAETGFMAAIENKFHAQIDQIKPYQDRDHIAITNYWLLWKLRRKYHLNILDDIALNGISGSGLTKDQQEIIERKGGVVIRDSGIISSRFQAGLVIQMELDKSFREFNDLSWGLLEATEGDFLVADGYDDLAFIPIKPRLAFLAGVQDQKISREAVADLNRGSISEAKEYYFARNINFCPTTSKL